VTNLQGAGFDIFRISEASEVHAGQAEAISAQLHDSWPEVEAQAQQADLIVCELVTHAHVAHRLAACAAKSSNWRQHPAVCIGVSSPLVWARTPCGQPAAGPASSPGPSARAALAHAGDGQQGKDGPGVTDREVPANSDAGNVGEAPATKQGWSGADYRQRRAAPSALSVKQAEDALLLRHVAGRLSTYIICPGVLYGNGEWHLGLHAAFAGAWQGDASTIMSMIGDGSNCMPMLHVADLATCMTALSTAAMDQRYIIMTDDFRGTQTELMRAISSRVGSGKTAAATLHSGLMSQVRTAVRHHSAPGLSVFQIATRHALRLMSQQHVGSLRHGLGTASGSHQIQQSMLETTCCCREQTT
jgi:hypothetical protein